jgi:hypothetical protein
MTTEIERELRELFREKAGEAPVAAFNAPTAAPQEVLRRGRRHQVGTVLGSAAIILVLIVGSVAGLDAVLRGEADPFRTGDYEVFERPATIEAFSLSGPSDWFLVNEWPASVQLAVGSGSASGSCTIDAAGNQACTSDIEPADPIHPQPYGLPILQLSNVDLGLASNACRDGLPAGAAALYIALDPGASADHLDPFPPGPMPGMPAPTPDGPCGAGSYSRFTVNGHPMFSWVGWSPGATEDDRTTVRQTWEQMWAHDDWDPSTPENDTAAYVIAGGVTRSGDDWQLELRPSQENVELSLVGVAASSDFVIPPSVIEWAATDPIFGAISKQAAAVEFRGKGDPSVAIAGTILPLPPTMPFDFDLFFIEGTAGIDGEAVALGPDGETIDGPTSIGTVREGVVRLDGSLLGHDWGARFTGAFADESACVRVTVDGGGEGPLCVKQLEGSLAGVQPALSSWVTNELAIFAGSVPEGVVELRFTSDDGTDPSQQFRCQMGPSGWTDPDKNVCAIALPPEGSGRLQYLDANGAVVFEKGNGWGSTQVTSNAYPWVNEGGFVTASGSFQGADWKLEVLHYRDGYRLTIDGREVFLGTVPEEQPVAFPLFQGDRGRSDALVLMLDGGPFADHVSVTSEGTWDGRWIPGSTMNGGEARLWVIEAPGAGTGRLLVDGADRGTVSWP